MICTNCKKPETVAVVTIAEWMAKFREHRAAESRFSKGFHTLATEAHAILGRLLMDGFGDTEAADRACQLLAFLRDLRSDIIDQRRVAQELSDSGAASQLNTYCGSWIARINTMLNPPANIAVTERAG